ncbi:hypothetical protein [Lactobacillus kalixensis]|nr:hypothetical protein [Lactobacillus kalixensis]
MTETIRTERTLLKKLAKRKAINRNDPAVTKDPYLIQDLQNKGLVKTVPKTEVRNHITNTVDWDYALSPEGEHYFQQRREELKRFLFRSVFVPIAVSVITTLVTTQLIPFIWHILQPK